jgi:hypothetical protein
MEWNRSKSRPASKAELEAGVEQMKQSAPSSREIEEAAARVWMRVSEEAAVPAAGEPAAAATLRDCGDYQSLFPTYLGGDLGRSRVLLLEDHLSECLACRRALGAVKRDSAVDLAPEAGTAASVFRTWKWAGAAAAVLVIGLVSSNGVLRQVLFPLEVSASAQSVRGRLFRVVEADLEEMRPGDRISSGESVRTATDSGAVLVLDDGSRIEMRERSELALLPAADGVRIRLERGGVIVEAADQRAGHLYVSTDDVDVAVVGTVFSVSEGTKGARVSVIEGEVRVEQGVVVRSLFPGEQFNSSGTLTEVPIEEEIAWSQESDRYVELMLQLSVVERELLASVISPELRYTSTLMNLVPAETRIYAAFPNLARTITQAYDILSTRVQENELTRQWWEQLHRSDLDGSVQSPELETMMTYLRSFSGQIREEVVVAIGENGPMLLTEVEDPVLVADVLRGIAAISAAGGPHVATSMAELLAHDVSTGPLAYVDGNLLALSFSVPALLEVANGRQSGGGTAFVSTSFAQSLSAIYGEGTDWLFAADLDGIVNSINRNRSQATDQMAVVQSFLGFDSVNDLFVDFKSVNGQATTRAAVTFSQDRSGVASWIAEAGPMGGLEFVSPQAMAVASGLTRDIGSIVGEVFLALERLGPEPWGRIVEFQQEHRFDLQYDLASAFGGEFVFAIDGPVLPEPSWKAVFEVYNSAVLQNAIERMVFEFNRVADLQGRPLLELSAETAGGRIYHTLAMGGATVEAHYVYSGGYMVIAPSRALVSQALQYDDTRTTLGNSTAFRQLFPSGGQNYCSAVFYQNVGVVTDSLSSVIESSGMGGDRIASIEEALATLPPMMGCVIAEQNRIIALNEGDSAFNLMTMGGLSVLLDRLGGARD